MGFSLYDENEWFNINDIAKLGKWLNVIIGPRERPITQCYDFNRETVKSSDEQVQEDINSTC